MDNNRVTVAIDKLNRIFTIPIPKVGTNFIHGYTCAKASAEVPRHGTYIDIKTQEEDVFWGVTTYEEVLEYCSDYKMFQIVRHPLERFLSGIAQVLCLQFEPDGKKKFRENGLLEVGKDYSRRLIVDFLSKHTGQSLFEKMRNNPHIREQSKILSDTTSKHKDVTWFIMDDMLAENLYHWSEYHGLQTVLLGQNKLSNLKINSNDSLGGNPHETIRYDIYNQLMPYFYDDRFSRVFLSDIYEVLHEDFVLYEKVKKLAYRGAEQ